MFLLCVCFTEMLLCVLVVLLYSQFTLASDSLKVNMVDSVTVRQLGSSVVLPCWISPPQDVTAMEVRWYRQNKFGTPVLLYQNQKLSTDSLENSYRNRSSLTVRDAQSAGLKSGDVSLRLGDVKLEDAGIFFCYVSGDKAYNSGNMTLHVAVLGSSPVLSLQLVDGQVNVTCSSCGWYPQPTVKWTSGSTTPLYLGGSFDRKDTDGLICVHSWVLLSPSDHHLVSCSFSNTAGDERGGAVDLQNITQFTGGAAGPWKALFVAVLLALLAAIAVGIFIYKKYKSGYVQTKTDEEDPSAAIGCANMDALRKDAVNITLNRSKAHADLRINVEGKVVRDSNAADNNRGPGFPYFLTVPGINSFSSGRVYWEVGLTVPCIEPKQKWLIGVQKDSNVLSNNKADLVPSKGFWFLCSDGENGIHVNTEPELSLPIRPTPEVVGVLLDFEKGELSFFNAKESIHLFTIKHKFQGEIEPIFNQESEIRLLFLSLPSANPACRGRWG
uniref:Cabz01076234.2 n=1 Tax=Astyanax mexicanus TaxID=7994 RepID=W5KBW4_ASTMX